MTNQPSCEKASSVGQAQLQPAGQGQLSDVVRCLRQAGQPAVLSEDGSEAWIPGVQAELQRIPMERTIPPDVRTIREVLAQPKTYIASFMLAPGPKHPANCFDYLCSDRQYRVESLTKNGRRDVRRGLRSFSVRPCTWEEVIAHGFTAYADGEARHGHAPPPGDILERLAAKDGRCPYFQLWGAWDKQGLAAWIRVIKVDDWASITTACSRHDALRDCPNNAVTYEATRTFLTEEGRRYVSYGVSSLQATGNILSLHKFKVRMGFKPVPMHRRFVVHPLLRPALQTRPASWLWDALAAAKPSSVILSKVAGMARLLTGRAGDPLAWAQDLDRE